MPRKLKTYQTSQGFYDLAIAAPSMKAALEAWGASSNLFHHGFAKEVHDTDVIAAAMEKPGIILRRPVGSNAPFNEHSTLPIIESLDGPGHKAKEPSGKKPKGRKPPTIGEVENRKAAISFEREQKRREKQREKEEAAAAEVRAQQHAAMVKADAALEAAKEEHEAIVGKIDDDRAAIDRRAEAEETLPTSINSSQKRSSQTSAL